MKAAAIDLLDALETLIVEEERRRAEIVFTPGRERSLQRAYDALKKARGK